MTDELEDKLVKDYTESSSWEEFCIKSSVKHGHKVSFLNRLYWFHKFIIKNKISETYAVEKLNDNHSDFILKVMRYFTLSAGAYQILFSIWFILSIFNNNIIGHALSLPQKVGIGVAGVLIIAVIFMTAMFLNMIYSCQVIDLAYKIKIAKLKKI